MNKELLDDEIEFPDDIISFLKVKYPKAYTDQEKAVLKQTEQLVEEKKELKDIISKKREQAKFKSLPVNIIPSEEAKEKAIKLVQDGTLLLTPKTKTIELDEPTVESHHSNVGLSSQKPKSRPNDESKKIDNQNLPSKAPTPLNSSKIAFVSAGYAFNEEEQTYHKKTDDGHDQNLKRSISLNSSVELSSKRNRTVSNDNSDCDEGYRPSFSERSVSSTSESRGAMSNGSALRFCGHNMREDFVRQIVEPYGSILSLEVEERCENSSNVVVTLESSEAARLAKEALDSQFIDGRVVNVYFKRGGGGEFSQRRPFRRRRGRTDSARLSESGAGRRGGGRYRFPRNDAFSQPTEYDNVLPSHFYSSGTEYDNNVTNRKTRWSISDEGDVSEQRGAIGDKTSNLSSGSSKTQPERLLVQYNDLDPI